MFIIVLYLGWGQGGDRNKHCGDHPGCLGKWTITVPMQLSIRLIVFAVNKQFSLLEISTLMHQITRNHNTADNISNRMNVHDDSWLHTELINCSRTGIIHSYRT